MSERIYILEENSLRATFKLLYVYSFMLSLKVHPILELDSANKEIKPCLK